MKHLDHLKLVGISMIVAFSLVACDKPGPAETAGKKIDEATEEASEEMEEAATEAGELGDKLGQQGRKAVGVIDDAAITAKVKAAFLGKPDLKPLQIGVTTVDGVVTLSGRVDSMEHSDRAKELVSEVDGVKDVENNLELK